MENLLKKYDKLEENLLVFSLILNVIIVLVQVIMRAVFNYSLSWTEELSRYIFIWQTWLGTSIALKYNEHISVGLLFNFIKSVRVTNIIKLIADIIWFVFSVFLMVSGAKLTQSMISRNAISSGMQIPLAFVYGVIPFCSLMVCIRLIFKIKDSFKTLDVDKSVDLEEEIEQELKVKEGGSI